MFPKAASVNFDSRSIAAERLAGPWRTTSVSRCHKGAQRPSSLAAQSFSRSVRRRVERSAGSRHGIPNASSSPRNQTTPIYRSCSSAESRPIVGAPALLCLADWYALAHPFSQGGESCRRSTVSPPALSEDQHAEASATLGQSASGRAANHSPDARADRRSSRVPRSKGGDA